MAQVSYRREILISTRQFENQRFAVELSDTLRDGETHAQCWARLRDAGNELLADEIMAMESGVRDAIRHRSRETVAKKYGL